MVDKDKIKAEVERLNKLVPYDREDRHSDGLHDAYFAILKYIDSLPEEPVSSDLEEAANEHAAERFRTTRDEFLAEKCKWSFITGAKYYKKQMINKACEWLRKELCDYFDAPREDYDMFIKDFKKAMED